MAGLNEMLQSNQAMMVALVLLGVLALCYKEFVHDAGIRVRLTQDGFVSGSSLAAMVSQRTDTGSDTSSRSVYGLREGLNFEPPVFWNAGDANAINAYHQDATRTGTVVNSTFDGTDMRNFDRSLDEVGSAHATKFDSSTEGYLPKLGREGLGVRVGGMRLTPY